MPGLTEGEAPLDGRREGPGRNPVISAILGTILITGAYAASGRALGWALGARPPTQDEAAKRLIFMLLSILAQLILFMAGSIFLARRWHSSRPLAYLGFKRISAGQILLGLAWLPAIIPLADALSSLGESLLPSPHSELAGASLSLHGKSVLEISISLVAFVLAPALCEEAHFRGFLQHGLQRRLAAPLSFLASGLLFTVNHAPGGQALGLLPVGILLAFLFWHSGSVWPGVTLHAAYNALAVLWANAAALPVWMASGGGLRPWPLAVSAVLTAVLVPIMLRSRGGKAGA